MGVWVDPRGIAIALVLLATATAVYGASSPQSRCDSGKLLAASKFAQCRLKVESVKARRGDRLSAVEQARMEVRCSARVAETFARLERIYPVKGMGEETQCSHYGDAANLVEGLTAVSDLVGDGSVAAAGSDAFDSTINDSSVCASAGGIWTDEGCVPGNPYNCTLAGFCSSLAAALPGELEYYSNAYVGHELGAGVAVGCLPAHWSAGTTMSTGCGGHACLVMASQVCG